MFELLLIASVIGAGIQIFKEATEKPVPAENWANKELMEKDRLSGMSSKQILKNLENGKYKIVEEPHPEPHRDHETGKILIENCKLYEEDLFQYGAVQRQKWVEQGKYNSY